MSDYPKQYFYLKIVKAKGFIDDNFVSNIDLDVIASEACFSKYDFIRQFKNSYGMTPYQYLIGCRMERAKNLLEQGNISVQQVCFEVGYESLSSFSSGFKQRYGKSPKQFQNSHEAYKRQIKQRPNDYVPICFSSRKL